MKYKQYIGEFIIEHWNRTKILQECILKDQNQLVKIAQDKSPIGRRSMDRLNT